MPSRRPRSTASHRAHRADRGDDRAGHEIAEIDGDGGRADVDGDAEGALGEAGEDRHDVAFLAHGGGRFPPAGAQRLLQARQHGEVSRRVGQAPLLGERLLQAAEVARRLAQVRLADLDVVQPNDGIDLDRSSDTGREVEL